MKYIDFRSDTVTVPTAKMREAMANAEVGDDVYEDDPTVIELETLCANIVGKEAALFVPTGTMGNQLAIMSYTDRGDEIIVEDDCHIVEHEVGATAVLSGVQLRYVKGSMGVMNPKDVENSIREEDIHHPKTSLICIENALSNGNVIPLHAMESIYKVAKRNNIPVHLDGARLFNASVSLGVEANEITQYTDSVMFCLSKGLCAPIGSIVAGSKEFVTKARKNRKLLGGGMRQVGIIAAAGIIAVKDMTKRLHIDHENALYLGEQLSKIPGFKVELEKIKINMVFFDISDISISQEHLVEELFKKGIKSNGAYKGILRFVTNNDISRKDIDYTIHSIKEILL